MASNEWPIKAIEEGVLSHQEVEKVEQAVQELCGSNHKIVGVEKKVIVREEEVIMVNGTPIALEGREGAAVKECLLRGAIPNQDLLNHLLQKAGLLVAPNNLKPIKAEADVTTTTTSRESAFLLHNNGQDVVDHKVCQVKEVKSSHHEEWAPLATPELEEPEAELNLLPPAKSRVTNRSSKAVLSPVPHVPHMVLGDDGESIDSATLEELIHELVPRAHSAPSESFQFAFLLSSRLFITPNRLLSEVYRRADQLGHMLSPESHPAFGRNLVSMLSQWMVWFPTDFRDESVTNRARQLVKLIVECHPPAETRLCQLLQTLATHLSAIDRHEKYMDRLGRPSLKSCDLQDLTAEYSATTFAQELTRIELEHLCFLGPEELVHAFAKESSSSTSSHCLPPPIDAVDAEAQEARQRAANKTKNLQAYISWFNRLSFSIATSVCKKKKKKQRMRVIEFWIEVARECVNIGNFNSLMGIITGLNMTPVARLKKTWHKIQCAGKFAVLEHQMDPSSNFLSYRSTLRAAISRSEGTTDQRQRIVIPFFSLLIKDLFVVNEAAASRLQNGHINFAKARQLGEQLREFSNWKDVDCPYAKTPVVADYLQFSPTLSEKVLDLESYECEPPELQEEKDHYKKIKHELKDGQSPA